MIIDKRMLSDSEGAQYVGLGITRFRIWAKEIGAQKKIGNRSLNDKKVIDKWIDEIGGNQSDSEME